MKDGGVLPAAGVPWLLGGIALINQVNYHWSLLVSPHHRVNRVWFSFVGVTLSRLARTYVGVKVFDFLFWWNLEAWMKLREQRSPFFSAVACGAAMSQGFDNFPPQTRKADGRFQLSLSESCLPVGLHTLFWGGWSHNLLFVCVFTEIPLWGIISDYPNILIVELQSNFWHLWVTSDSPRQPQTFFFQMIRRYISIYISIYIYIDIYAYLYIYRYAYLYLYIYIYIYIYYRAIIK